MDVPETLALFRTKQESQYLQRWCADLVRSGRLMGTVGDDRNRAKGVAAGRREASGAAAPPAQLPVKKEACGADFAAAQDDAGATPPAERVCRGPPSGAASFVDRTEQAAA